MTLFSDIARFTTILLTIFLVNKYNYNTNFLIIVIKLYSQGMNFSINPGQNLKIDPGDNSTKFIYWPGLINKALRYYLINRFLEMICFG